MHTIQLDKPATEAALAADLFTAKPEKFEKNQKIWMDLAPGGPNPCMHTKRLDNPAAEAALAADLLTA